MRTDRYGFPIQTCTRCGGSGEYSYNQRHGSVCYGCNGSGVVHTKRAAAEWNRFRADRRALLTPSIRDLVVGDLARQYGAPKGTPFAAVVAVEDTGVACGWSHAPDGTKIVTDTRYTVRFADGTAWESTNGCCLARRQAVLDPAPYVARAQGVLRG
jgi:hypothetical protein